MLPTLPLPNKYYIDGDASITTETQGSLEHAVPQKQSGVLAQNTLAKSYLSHIIQIADPRMLTFFLEPKGELLGGEVQL